MTKYQSIRADELTHQNITNLVSVEHDVFVDDVKTTAVTTGLLQEVVSFSGGVHVLVGGSRLGLLPEAKVTVHSTYVEVQAPEIMQIVRDAVAEDAVK